MLDWEELLISLYYKVSDLYERDLVWYAQRFSNNMSYQSAGFSDEEAITIYLFGLIRKRRQVKEIYTYTQDHLWSWFPKLPSYQKFNERLNRLSPALNRLVACLMDDLGPAQWLVKAQGPLLEAVVDSMPIILAKASRSEAARVARDIADKGRCASKNLWYHGVKLHDLGFCNPTTMPIPALITLSRASENDLTVFKEAIAPNCYGLCIFGDKIYHDQKAAEELKSTQNIELMPCHKRKKGQVNLPADQKLINTMISQIRQPVESFFNWIEEKTGIQNAAKVRSTPGLLKHIFGRLAAALFLLIQRV